MKVERQLEQQIGLERILAFARIKQIVALALLLGGSCVLSISAISTQADATRRGFVEWCLNQAHLSSQTKHTVDVLLRVAGTQDCHQANNKLSTLDSLDLSYNRIADLKPLSSPANLTSLRLENNQIANVKLLFSLTNLTTLYLRNNQTLTNKTCPLKPLCNF